MGGGGRFGPLAICQITGAILDPKTTFDSSWHEFSEHVGKLYLKVADDVTGRVEAHFYHLSLLASPGKPAVSNLNKADGTAWIEAWDASNYPPKTFMTSCQIKVIRGHVKFKIMCFWWGNTCFGSDFRQECKK